MLLCGFQHLCMCLTFQYKQT
uniref:Uncharacterized protein n=1 Tax=Heterorhabditis bacteriophora TaxID=37862 RepID=A0A1I7WFJ2_HETBA